MKFRAAVWEVKFALLSGGALICADCGSVNSIRTILAGKSARMDLDFEILPLP